VTGIKNASSSPFVIAINKGGIPALPSIFNFVILMSVIAVGYSCIFVSSRTIAALATVQQAPKIFAYLDSKGRPIVAIIFALLFGFLAYISIASSGTTVLHWMYSIASLSSFFTWGSICLCHIRFRTAWIAQGQHVYEIPKRAVFGVFGSWFGLIMNILFLIAQFYIAIWPVGTGGTGTAADFFEAYLAGPVLVLFYVVYKIVKWDLTGFIRKEEMDISTGRGSSVLDEIEREQKEAKDAPWIIKVRDFLLKDFMF